VQLISELESHTPKNKTLLAIGVFDGVHLGHQHLISKLTQEAASRGLLSGIVTFTYHPRAVLSPRAKLARLTTVEERTHLLMDLGVQLVVPLTVDAEVAALGARAFVGLLQQYLRMQGLIIGPDFALGRGREGNAAALMQLGHELGFTVDVVEPFKIGNAMASSTAIRRALDRGDVGTASALLGHPFSLRGAVVGGVERGHELGYPTANIAVDSEQALPKDGVYATLGRLGDSVYKSVTNIGVRPTFDHGERTIEVFLIDFDANIYGQTLTIDLVEHLRGEAKFATVDELVAQIGRDVEQAKAILG
jgi:riboflavin kinase/FMN adenylyltransferase